MGGVLESWRGDAHPRAPIWLSLLLVLEVTIFGRPAADRDGAARVDPADEHGEPYFASLRPFRPQVVSDSAGYFHCEFNVPSHTPLAQSQ